MERAVPFDPRASSGDAGVMPWKPALEPVVPRGVADGAEEGILGFGDSDVWVDRDVEEGILDIVAAAV